MTVTVFLENQSSISEISQETTRDETERAWSDELQKKITLKLVFRI